MKKIFKKEVLEEFQRTATVKPDILTEKDLVHLPSPVKKYLLQAGVVGKEKVHSMRIVFDGKIRSRPEDPWMKFKSVQYNFFNQPTRIFYIKARKMGIPATGLHLYQNAKAIMVIKLAGLFKMVDARGPEMDQGETVTVFNDMCFMAPATLIDPNIQWKTINNSTVRASYSNSGIRISADLVFNDKGELVNFISNDRFETTDGKNYMNYPWLTPVETYNEIKGYRLASKAFAIYRHPDKDFCYGEFSLKDIEYNCSSFQSL
jgi:hypothetical protein